jgi:transposase InsO family protein
MPPAAPRASRRWNHSARPSSARRRKIRLRRRRGQEDRAGRHGFGAFSKAVAAGTKLRHDHGSQFVADDFQAELAFLGLESSPAFVREPEGNGCAERFIRVLKENLLWIRRFDTVEDLRQALHAFKDAYNRGWILQRHGYLTPAQVRAEQTATAMAA